MEWIYSLGVEAYQKATALAGIFNSKARKRAIGAATTLKTLTPTPPGQDCYWMHCASVGEFEQGRPVWENLQVLFPDARFVLSFFSPSGYEHFSGKSEIGEVVYLPWDLTNNAEIFIRRLSPKLALIVKYEWWLGYHAALKKYEASSVVFSAAFRQNQPFFRWYGRAWRQALSSVDQVFVQDEKSKTLLSTIGYTNVEVVGDTRFDRTIEIRNQHFEDQRIEAWTAKQQLILVAGSTWPKDETLLADFLASTPGVSLMIAPHELNDSHIQQLNRQFSPFGLARYTCVRPEEIKPEHRVLLIDVIGLLSRLYRFGSLAYVGGGFGAGIHNTLEPAAYGIPIGFGPNHSKFLEASALLDKGIATEINNAADMTAFAARFSSTSSRKQVLAKAEEYIAHHSGATKKIIDHLRKKQLL